MNAKSHQSLSVRTTLELLFFLAVLAGFGYGYYRYSTLSAKFESAKLQFASTTDSQNHALQLIAAQLSSTTQDNVTLAEALNEARGKNDYYDNQLKSVTTILGTYEKLSKIDRELLQKYSKVYFLNENYVPSSLTDIHTSEFAFDKTKPLSIHTLVWPHLQALLQAAASSSVPIRILSAYRSFGTQATLKYSYKVVFGSGANQFSADQGYSEHQLGTAVDFTTPAIGSTLDPFKNSSAYQWLLDNAYRYGFILSYPEHNMYYQFEPWHWRFVGVALATALHDDDRNFYDVDQRELDLYLVSIFD